MAFGFGFNKQKVLNAAEKFVQQGKLPNAITEYEKILKADPKDLTVMNTVGDLLCASWQQRESRRMFQKRRRRVCVPRIHSQSDRHVQEAGEAEIFAGKRAPAG